MFYRYLKIIIRKNYTYILYIAPKYLQNADVQYNHRHINFMFKNLKILVPFFNPTCNIISTSNDCLR